MDRCNRSRTLRALVAVVTLVIGSLFVQARDGGLFVPTAGQAAPDRFVAYAFPTAEAGVVAHR